MTTKGLREFSCLLMITILFLLVCNSAYARSDIYLLLDRSEHRLFVKRDMQVIKSYKVALGYGGKGAKQQRGDGKTPTGHYKITAIRSSQRFHLFLQLNYPNPQDAKLGLQKGLINHNEYAEVLAAHVKEHQPPQDLALGGAIGIHGIGRETRDKIDIHQSVDWTEGCIALRNREVEELSTMVSVGTEILIVD